VKVELDTNSGVSGFLWDNEPRAIVDAAIDGRIELFTFAALIAELAGVLPRQKFAKRLAEKQLLIPAIVERYCVLADIVEPAILSSPVSPDPDDDVVLTTALAAYAELIVSRGKHLRNLKHFHRIPILNATDTLHSIERQTRNGISN
jgi:putative PIN family toxin of toxin-antitoxin system